MPKDPEVIAAAVITLGALVFLVAVSRIFRDVNPS